MKRQVTLTPLIRSSLRCLLASLFIGIGVSADAQLLHRYDFVTDANDTVGSAHGTLVGGATISGGALTTAGGNGAVNGTWSGTGPRLTLDPSAVAGITGAFSIETWFSATTGWPKYDSLYAFSDTTRENYLLAAPVRGYGPWPSGVGIKGAGGDYNASFDMVLSGIYLDTPGIHQTVLTYDGTTFSYYVNGALADFSGLPSTGTSVGFNLSTLTAIGINGGSPWDDPSLTGSTYDFRIYGQSLTPDQVSAVYGLGVDAPNAAISLAVVPEPSSLALFGIAGALLACLRRRH
jgi:hypothetical protein